ncbi:unnamed protein product [Closterium sp. NIES-54]
MAELNVATLTQEQLDRLMRQLEESALEIATLTAERDSARQQSTANAPSPTNAPAHSEEPIVISSGKPTQNDSVEQRSGVASEGAAHSMSGMERNRVTPSPREPREARRHVEFAATSGEYAITAPMPLKPQRPPCFDPSQRGGPTIQSWIFTMNVFFDANYVESDAAKICYTVSLLRGPAMDWWRVIVTSPRAYEPPSQEDRPTGPAVTWSSFCETAQYSTWDAWCAGLRARFEPIAASISARQKLRTWRQLGSVQDCAAVEPSYAATACPARSCSLGGLPPHAPTAAVPPPLPPHAPVSVASTLAAGLLQVYLPLLHWLSLLLRAASLFC